MDDSETNQNPASAEVPTTAATLGSATYEIIRQRLQKQGGVLRERIGKLDARRQEVFGSVEHKLLRAERITTAHNCVPRDMVHLGQGRFLFGFNVNFGLKQEIELGDVFSIFAHDDEAGALKEAGLEVLESGEFVTDFRRLYNVYEKTVFRKFSIIDGFLYMVFAIGSGVNDISVFKWAFNDGQLRFVDGRAEAEYRRVGFPASHGFRWKTPDREAYRYGDYPHISIEDRVFVECTDGDLTIKVEDNTSVGQGIYSEPVEDKYQKVDDATVAYATIDHLILLKVRPYKERETRYFIFNEKQETVVRVDSIGQSCALLPEDHGLIFPDGYYLATGELKLFDGKEEGLILERVVYAPNGEDVLYSFYNRLTGDYALMPYRLIQQTVEERVSCNGFTLFPNGHMVVFRAEMEPQKHHMVQLRQTPFYQIGNEPEGSKDAFLYQVGNKDVVRCLSECNEVLTLIRKENPYAELYADLVSRCGTILDAYAWLNNKEGFEVDGALKQVREAADKAVDEFDKVLRLQHEALRKVAEARKHCEDRFQEVQRASFKSLNDYVENLAALRQLRGELITLKDVRYVDERQITALEEEVVAQADDLSARCVKFLLKPEALEPYRKDADAQLAGIAEITKVAEGKEVEAAVAEAGGELEMLIDILNSLEIEDATETTRIIDGITAVYTTLNQVKAALKKRLRDLVTSEGEAQFAAQLKLLGQSATSYLDLCDTPTKCEEYLNRISVQLEELEGAFADFDDYVVQLSERRTELYEAFEQRKLSLIEQRNRRASALMTSAERILKVIQNRLAGFKSIEEINTYMASDLMISKVRETVEQLLELNDSVKADDLQGRIKSAQQEAVRQLKDRLELFVDGQAVIRLGKHRFNTNTQPLDLTVVHREGDQFIHLTSTKYFQEITDPDFLSLRDVWEQDVGSENAQVYRAEFLANRLLKSLESGSHVLPAGMEAKHAGETIGAAEALALPDAERLLLVQDFMSSRYQEGYTKGIHDLDAAKIFHALVSTHLSLQLARYEPAVRGCAAVYWAKFCPAATVALWSAKLNGFAARNRVFPGDPGQAIYISALQGLIADFIGEAGLYPESLAAAAGEYLFYELIGGETFVVSDEARRLVNEFQSHLVGKGSEAAFVDARNSLGEFPRSELELVRDWVRGFLMEHPASECYLDEVVALIFCGDALSTSVVEAGTRHELDGLKGGHAVIDGSRYDFDYLEFTSRLQEFEEDVVPRFEKFRELKNTMLDRERKLLRLDEFETRVLSSFVRNELLDEVYLPLIGDNLAKQIGAAGDQKRTDLMGLLLLISPPGYGKTTLMEYIANRLGIVFVKINGPALGHSVTSLDPEEAPNAAARDEVNRLNFALEMGDNAMLYVDDIQHCNPEFLQKFISLCDAQRKIEGVWKGKSRTYDLRGRKVVVVMAGNPYTESGEKFKVPDMLANRADTYNLGDIIGSSAKYFKASYIENAITSNAVLAPLGNKSQKDVRQFIRMAESGERTTDGLEASYSSQEVEEILNVMQKLVTVREVILAVNLEYIRSAGQANEYRTEPAFKLQGSYRNMNRLAEKVVAIMNDDEIDELVLDHYKGESQTLTTGAEANFLKFKELIDVLTPDEAQRWADIKKSFKRNLLVHGGDANDPVGRVVTQLATFHEGLEAIQMTISDAVAKPVEPPSVTIDTASLVGNLEGLRGDLTRAISEVHSGTMSDKVTSLMHEMEMLHRTLATLKDVSGRQRDYLRSVEEMLVAKADDGVVEIQLTEEMLQNERKFLDTFHQILDNKKEPSEAPEADEPPPTKPS